MRKSIISAIYYGMDVSPATMKTNEEQRKYLKTCSELYDKLLAMLNDKQKKILESFADARDDEACVAIERNFVAGFRLGLLIGIECMDEFPAEEH